MSSTITIEYSEFARNGFGDGFTHNIYIGKSGVLNVRYSFFHEAKIGHNLKTRARENNIENSYFSDGSNGTSSYLLNFDNGGRAVVRGNLLHKGPLADNSILITHYTEYLGCQLQLADARTQHAGVSDLPRRPFHRYQHRSDSRTNGLNIFAGTGNPPLLGLNGHPDEQRCHRRGRSIPVRRMLPYLTSGRRRLCSHS